MDVLHVPFSRSFHVGLRIQLASSLRDRLYSRNLRVSVSILLFTL